MSVFHSDCSDAVSGMKMWNYNKCRNLSNDIDCLKNQVTEFHDILFVKVQKQKDFYFNISRKLRNKQYNKLFSNTSSSGSNSSSPGDDSRNGSTTTRPHH